MASKENYLENVEKALKRNINLLLSTNKENNTTGESLKGLNDALKDFEGSIQNLKSFFDKSVLLQKNLHPEYYEKQEIQEMKTELNRKDNLIKEQIKKLSRYRAELEVLQEAQLQGITKN